MYGIFIINWFAQNDGMKTYNVSAEDVESAFLKVLEDRGVLSPELKYSIGDMINDYTDEDDFISISELSVIENEISYEVALHKVHGDVEEL